MKSIYKEAKVIKGNVDKGHKLTYHNFIEGMKFNESGRKEK